MKTKLAIFTGCLVAAISTASIACNNDWGCGSSCSSPSCGEWAGNTCGCADPLCKEDNPCMSASTCCEAFGNISGIAGFPND